MFAKLKKKVIEENGGRIEGGDKSLGTLPPSRGSSGSGTPIVQSPVSKDAPQLIRASYSYSVEHLASGDDSTPSKETGTSREDLLAMLTKRTEQCKKMEGNISDLAALIKDKNKVIEQMESQIKSHEEALSKQLQEQKKEFEAYRDRLIAGYQEDKLALDKEKQDLRKRLRQAEEYRDRFLQKEADVDEIQDLKTQEMAKIKHMLLLTQQELEACRRELEDRSERLTVLQARDKHLQTELSEQVQKVDSCNKECERLKEDNRERAELVMSLTKEKSVFERRLDQLNLELTEKQSKIADLNRQMSDMDSQFRALEHSSETHRSKAELECSKLLVEKQDHIDVLQERVTTLEQRLQDQSLSGDDRVTALQTEREGLETKLSEARQQLTEIKSTWSDKIAQLEGQISHLNAKIVEDSEEMMTSQRATDSMRDNFHKQMEDFRTQLEDAEKRALENYELANSYENRYEHKVRELESELSRARLAAVDLETQLRGKATSLELQLMELRTARQAEQEELRHQIEAAMKESTAALSRELRQEHELTVVQAQCSHLQSELLLKENGMVQCQTELEEKISALSILDRKVETLESQVQQLQTDLGATRTELSTARRQYNQMDQEKGELMVRNAQLFQQWTTAQQHLSEARSESESQLADREQTIQTQQDAIIKLHDHLAVLELQVKDLEMAQAQQGSTDHQLQHLQDQLADKNRALKKQEQMLKDLRQTLQRELKVQCLPNDDSNTGSDDNNVPSPLTTRKLSSHQSLTSLSSHNNTGGGGANSTLQSSAVLTVSSSSTSSGPAAVKSMTMTNMMQVSQERGMVVRRDLEQDVNFQYLKHVVLKFMLSRECEAVQLIKAVAVLLNFSHQEQQLIKQTLEWKMSWFGPRPSTGKGQKSKIIPPTF